MTMCQNLIRYANRKIRNSLKMNFCQNQGNLTLLRASGDIGRQHIRNLHGRATM